MKLANDLLPTIVVFIVVVLLALFVVNITNRKQRETIETVKQAVKDRDAKARMESLIKSQMQEPENWNKASDLMNP